MARQRRVHPVIPAVLASVLVGGLLAGVATTSGGGDDTRARNDKEPAGVITTTTTAPTTTTTVPDAVERDALAVEGLTIVEPATYRISYDLVENDLARSETWLVDRPFRSLVVSERDGELISGAATSLEQLYAFLADRDLWLGIQGGRHRATFDLQPAAAVGVLEALGIVEDLGDDEIAGFECRRYRTGAPLNASTATAPSDEESTEFCLDGSGLVVHEVWRLDGDVVVERTVSDIDLAPEFDPDDFDPEPQPEDLTEYAPLLQIVAVPFDEGDPDVSLLTDIAAPDGWELVGGVTRSGTAGQGGPSSEVIRFFQNGTDLVEVRETYVDEFSSLQRASAVPVDGSGWEDEIWFQGGFRSSVISARISPSTYVDIDGTDPSVLFAFLDGTTVVG